MVGTYRVTIGHDRFEVDADQARADWDVHPSELRSGERAGAFILWVEDEIGRRRCPVIYKPVDVLVAVDLVEAAA